MPNKPVSDNCLQALFSGWFFSQPKARQQQLLELARNNAKAYNIELQEALRQQISPLIDEWLDEFRNSLETEASLIAEILLEIEADELPNNGEST
jgi:hypothetical protein